MTVSRRPNDKNFTCEFIIFKYMGLSYNGIFSHWRRRLRQEEGNLILSFKLILVHLITVGSQDALEDVPYGCTELPKPDLPYSLSPLFFFSPLFLLTLFFLSYPLLTQFLTLSFSFPRPRFSTFLISLSSSLKTFPLLLLVGVQGITPRKSYEILNAYTTCTLDYFPHIETGCEESIFINFYYFCRNIRDRTDSRISHNSVFKFMLLELLKKICLLAAGHTSTSWLRLRTGGINFLLCLCFVFWYF
jgi:hypothetical protein